MAQTRGNGLARLMLLMMFFAVAGTAVFVMPLEKINNTEHANERHIEAPLVRKRHKNGLCHETEAYISPRRGTLLVLCKMEKKPRHAAIWGGLIWRVLEMRLGELVLLGDSEMYECTVIAHDRAYWDRVIVRDGYIKAHDTRWYEPLRWLISPGR